MQFLFDLLPVLLFFISFKFYGIYVATTVGIVASFVQVILNRLWFSKWDNKQLVTFVVFVVFGGMTLYFHNPIFVKWKPTIVFWFFALAILITQFFTQRPMIQRIMQSVVEDKAAVPLAAWYKLNFMWAIFFLILGSINLYIAYFFSNDAWVNFKFYGITMAVLLFSIAQALYIARYISQDGVNNNGRS